MDLTSEPDWPPREAAPRTRPFVGLVFVCCQVYGRIHLTHDGAAFAGHCPRCGGAIRIEIDPDAPSGRFFVAG
jgi:hypothetical protein